MGMDGLADAVQSQITESLPHNGFNHSMKTYHFVVYFGSILFVKS